MMTFENRNYAFAGAFVDELARCGLRHVCICPGSRSTPLAVSFARQTRIKKWVHLDERSAAFFALGIARQLNEPVALVCSSGTAISNFLPALVEARYSSVPLVVLTADRPPELVDWGALQTIEQTGLYGSYVKWSVTMPPPEVTTALMAFVRSAASRAFATANDAPKGAVHLNFPFREPLEPLAVPSDLPESTAARQNEAYTGRPDGLPFLRDISATKALSAIEISHLASELSSVKRGLIICGPDTDTGLAVNVTALANRMGYPVLADCLSQVRCGTHNCDIIIDCYDAFIGDKKIAGTLAPEVVIRFGALPVSKPLTGYLEQHRSARQILVDNEGWRDPFHLTSEIWHIDAASFCADLLACLSAKQNAGEWNKKWRGIARTASSVIKKQLAEMPEMFEGRIFTELSRLLPENSLLFAGNSMPVRDMDTFFPSANTTIRFLSNRGASGIDGVVSTALGVSAVARNRLALVIGDISFYHDMNGLLAAKKFGLNATIIVINNDGGGIFSFLPQADYANVFEPYFGTPHGLTFKAAAEMYGLHYHLADNWKLFTRAVKKSLSGAGTTLIEVPGNRQSNAALHKRIRDAVIQQIHQTEAAKSAKNRS